MLQRDRNTIYWLYSITQHPHYFSVTVCLFVCLSVCLSLFWLNLNYNPCKIKFSSSSSSSNFLSLPPPVSKNSTAVNESVQYVASLTFPGLGLVSTHLGTSSAKGSQPTPPKHQLSVLFPVSRNQDPLTRSPATCTPQLSGTKYREVSNRRTAKSWGAAQ